MNPPQTHFDVDTELMLLGVKLNSTWTHKDEAKAKAWIDASPEPEWTSNFLMSDIATNHFLQRLEEKFPIKPRKALDWEIQKKLLAAYMQVGKFTFLLNKMATSLNPLMSSFLMDGEVSLKLKNSKSKKIT